MPSILFASTNKGKIKEVRAYLKEFGIDVFSPAGNKPWPDVAETKDTYIGNARLKAQAFYKAANMPSLGDDSGLEVRALKGQPGIMSARYAGPGKRSDDNITKLLAELRDVSDRSATFICALALIVNSKTSIEVQAGLEGSIAESPRGRAGFGYDSVFVVKGLNKTLAELKEGDGEVESHRTLALKELVNRLGSQTRQGGAE